RTVPDGNAAAEHPPIASVRGSPDAALELAIAAGVDRLLPDFEQGRDVLLVHDPEPGRAKALVRTEPRVLVPALVEVIDGTVRRAGPNELRHRLGESSKPAFTLDELLVVLRSRNGERRPIGDVLQQHAIVVRELRLTLMPGEREHADHAPAN